MNSDSLNRKPAGAMPVSGDLQVERTATGDPSLLTEQPSIPEASYDLRILQSLRRIIRAVEINSRKLAQSYRITGPQLATLRTLRDHGPLTTTGLAQLVYLSPSTIVGIVDRLEEKGLVTRTRSTRDRRQVQIVINDIGEKLVDTTPSLLQDTLIRALNELPEAEQFSITRSLEMLVHMMEARQIDAAPVLDIGSLGLSTAKGAKETSE